MMGRASGFQMPAFRQKRLLRFSALDAAVSRTPVQPVRSWFDDKRLDYLWADCGYHRGEVEAGRMAEAKLWTNLETVRNLLFTQDIFQQLLLWQLGALKRRQVEWNEPVPLETSGPRANLLWLCPPSRQDAPSVAILEYHSPVPSGRGDGKLLRRVRIPLSRSREYVWVSGKTETMLFPNRIRFLPQAEMPQCNAYVDLYLTPGSGSSGGGRSGEIAEVGTERPIEAIQQSVLLLEELIPLLKRF